jgi:peptidoglycan/xylan/chitin deacetylase (PgdA/CDA1 family)
MSTEQLQSLARRHIIGCHTATHMRLTGALSEAELEREIVDAKRSLEKAVGESVDSFAWVGGEESSYSNGAARRISRLFRYSFTTNCRVATPNTSPLQIDRTHLEADFAPSLLRFQLSGLMDLLYVLKRRRLSARGAVAVEPDDPAASTNVTLL